MHIGPGAAKTTVDSWMLRLLHHEHVFSVSDWFTFGADQVRYLVFNPLAYVPSPEHAPLIFGFFPAFAAEAGPITIDYFIDPDVADDGTAIGLFNRDGNSIKQAQSTFKIDPTAPVGEGTKFAGDLVPASATGAGHSAPGQSEEKLPFVINHTKKILIKIHNLNGAGTQVSIKFTIAEL